MKITILTLAAAISLAVFACSESPSSSPTDSSSSEVYSSSLDGASKGSSSSSDNSSSEIYTSSSNITSNGSSSSSSRASSSSVFGIAGRVCKYPGEDFGISGLFVCGEAPVDMLDLQKYKTECEEEGGAWANDCPGGEKVTCIFEENEYDKDVLYKIYADDFACGDLLMKNADGSEDVVPKGGACGPYFPYGEILPLSVCMEFPEIPTKLIKLSCAMEEIPFANKCQSNANLVCYDPEDESIVYYYGEALSSVTCEDLGFEDS